MTDAHDQLETIRLIWHIPAHEPREEDPHYGAFTALKRRLHHGPLWKCAIRGCTRTDLEVHHSKVEFSLQNGVDLQKLDEEYGLHLTDAEAFAAFIEGEGNAEVICALHHRTVLGVHHLPTPAWLALRVWRDDLPPPAEVQKGATDATA